MLCVLGCLARPGITLGHVGIITSVVGEPLPEYPLSAYCRQQPFPFGLVDSFLLELSLCCHVLFDYFVRFVYSVCTVWPVCSVVRGEGFMYGNERMKKNDTKLSTSLVVSVAIQSFSVL